MDKRLCVYFCSGCSIGSAVSIPSLEKTAKEASSSVVATRISEMLCSPEGRAAIEEDLASKDFDALVIAACSSRTHADTFRFVHRAIVERVALRERVVWVLAPGEEDTQLAAGDYVRMGVVRAVKTVMHELSPPVVMDVFPSVLVVGGGATGIAASLALAEAGLAVVLVEKQKTLGGWVASWGQLFPSRPPYCDTVDNDISISVKAVEKHERIVVYTSASVASISGQPGDFEVRIQRGDSERVEKVGAIVQATGWQPYDARRLSRLGYGHSEDVITHVELEMQLAEREVLLRPSDGGVPSSVVFVLCAGSRDAEHLSYCSAVCCRAVLKQAHVIRERYPEIIVHVLFKDIRTPGQYEAFYEAVQDDVGIFFANGDVTEVVERDGVLNVVMKNSLLGELVELQADLVVLAVGMVPVSGESMLNLTYRLGRELPVDKYGFPDSNFLCFPYETQRTGIYAAGCTREPMDKDACTEDAAGAALKAVQCIACAERGVAVHPRAGDRAVPEFVFSRCTQCKRCTEECPFGALDEDEKGTPKPNPNRCRRCAVCMGACPERVISFKDYSVDMIGSMIKAIEIPDESEEKPRYLAFVCENDILPALDLAAATRKKISPSVRFVCLRCIGSTNSQWVNDAIIRGMDGVMLIGCKSGDDYQCHFIKGSELCGVRMSKIQETLERLMLESERVVVREFSMGEWALLPDWINETVERIDGLGPNPNKGF